jgi:hypothetical protein
MFLAAAALAIAAASAAYAADAPKPAAAKPAAAAAAKPAAATPTPAQVANLQRAARILRTFNVLFESKETKPQVKAALLGCLYNNKLGSISAATGEVMAKNPAMKETNMNDVLHAAGGVCGLKFESKAAAAAPAPAAKPAGDTKTSTGR